MSFCPDCLQNGINSSLTTLGVDKKIRICENDNCAYVENCSIYKNNIENLSSIIEIKLEPSVDQDDMDFSLSSSDSESDNVTLKKNNNFEFNDYQVISVRRHLQYLLDASKRTPGIFNWFCLPLMLKFNTKICLFLIIQLDLFNSQKHSIIQNLKEIYCKTEDVVNNVPKKLISLLSFKFSQCLYKEHQIFNLSNMAVLDMTERIFRSMGNLISSLDNGDMYKTIYSYHEQCKNCSHSISYLKEDFSIRMMKSFTIENNTFSYNLQCKKCLGQCDASVTIMRLAKFIFIDLPNGTTHDFKSLMKTTMSTVTGDNIQLQAIIELQCSDVEDIPEKVPNINEYIFKKSVRQRIPYRIHFRNTDGWYCIDQKSALVVKTIFNSDIDIILSDIRILVYGHCNNLKKTKESLPPCSLYTELEEYKKAPWGSILYPRDEIKYWLYLFKYRDMYSKTMPNWRSKIIPLSNKITLKLNEYLVRKKQRLNQKLNSKNYLDSVASDKYSDDSEISDQDTDKDRELKVVNFKDFGKEFDKLRSEYIKDCSQETMTIPFKMEDNSCLTKSLETADSQEISLTDRDFLHPLYNTKVLDVEHGIDSLIKKKRMKMTKK